MKEIGLEWQVIDTPIQLKEVSTPATPYTGKIKLYAKDQSGVSGLCYINDAGNEVCLPVSGTIPTGTGAANRLTYWSAAATLDDVPRTLTAGSVLFVHSDFLPQEDNTKFFWDNTSKQLMIGYNSGTHFGTDAGLTVDEDGASSIIGSTAHSSSSATHAGGLNLQRSRGTHSGQTIVSSSDRISRIVSQGYDGSAYRDAAAIDAIVNGSPGASDMPGALQFLTTPDGSITLAIRATIDQKGDMGLGTTTPGYVGFTRTFSIESATNTALELVSSRADAADVLIGAMSAYYSTNTTNHKRLAEVQFSTSGTTANQRGGIVALYTKADASTTLSERFRVGPSGQWGIGGATFGTSGNPFLSQGSTSAPIWGSAFVFDNSNKYLGFNVTPTVDIEIFRQSAVPIIRVVGEWDVATMNSQFDLRSYSGSNANSGGIFRGMGLRGTKASPSATGSGDFLMQLVGDGYTNGLTNNGTAAIRFKAGSLWTATNAETKIEFDTTASGAVTATTRLTIESTGDISHASGSRHRMLSQNRFRHLNSMARVYRTTSQSIATATVTAIQFDNEQFDTDGLHDNATNNTRLTCQLTGKYVITAGVGLVSGGTIGATYPVLLRIVLNGLPGGTLLTESRQIAPTGVNEVLTCSCIYNLTSGDYIEACVYHTQGGNVNTTTDSQLNFFTMAYIGE